MSKEQSFVVKGNVRFAGVERGDKTKTVVTLKLDDARAEVLRKTLGILEDEYDGTPIKETENGKQFLKASTIYPIDIYENASIQDELTINDIGEDSEVEIMIIIAENTYKRKTYQVAYLKSVNILKLEEAIHFNPFAKGAEITSV